MKFLNVFISRDPYDYENQIEHCIKEVITENANIQEYIDAYAGPYKQKLEKGLYSAVFVKIENIDIAKQQGQCEYFFWTKPLKNKIIINGPKENAPVKKRPVDKVGNHWVANPFLMANNPVVFDDGLEAVPVQHEVEF